MNGDDHRISPIARRYLAANGPSTRGNRPVAEATNLHSGTKLLGVPSGVMLDRLDESVVVLRVVRFHLRLPVAAPHESLVL
jgi:hypothetical protein